MTTISLCAELVEQKAFGFSRLFLLHRQSSVADLTHYVVAPSGKYFLMGKSSELGGKFDSLWTSVVGGELLPGRTWLQSEWMSTSQVLEFAAGTVEKYLYTTWFAIP